MLPFNSRAGRAAAGCAPCRRRRAQAGFTIAEVGITAMILLLCIASSIVTLGYGFRAIDNARYTTLAGQILQSQMEKLRMLTWGQLTDPTTGPATGPFVPDITAS